MTVQEIINRARRMTYTNSVQYTDTQAVEDFNIIYADVVNSIIQEVDEWYFWGQFTADIVSWQNEYSLQEDFWKVSTLSIKYTDTSEYTLAKYLDTDSLDKDSDYYKTNQSKSSPFYDIKNNSLFIYPSPTEDITDWLRIKSLLKSSDLIISSTEDDIVVSKEYHFVLAEWMKQFMYQSRWKIQEKNDAINEYKLKKSDMIFQLSDRTNLPTTWTLPSNINYYA